MKHEAFNAEERPVDREEKIRLRYERILSLVSGGTQEKDVTFPRPEVQQEVIKKLAEGPVILSAEPVSGKSSFALRLAADEYDAQIPLYIDGQTFDNATKEEREEKERYSMISGVADVVAKSVCDVDPEQNRARLAREYMYDLEDLFNDAIQAGDITRFDPLQFLEMRLSEIEEQKKRKQPDDTQDTSAERVSPPKALLIFDEAGYLKPQHQKDFLAEIAERSKRSKYLDALFLVDSNSADDVSKRIPDAEVVPFPPLSATEVRAMFDGMQEGLDIHLDEGCAEYIAAYTKGKPLIVNLIFAALFDQKPDARIYTEDDVKDVVRTEIAGTLKNTQRPMHWSSFTKAMRDYSPIGVNTGRESAELWASLIDEEGPIDRTHFSRADDRTLKMLERNGALDISPDGTRVAMTPIFRDIIREQIREIQKAESNTREKFDTLVRDLGERVSFETVSGVPVFTVESMDDAPEVLDRIASYYGNNGVFRIINAGFVESALESGTDKSRLDEHDFRDVVRAAGDNSELEIEAYAREYGLKNSDVFREDLYQIFAESYRHHPVVQGTPKDRTAILIFNKNDLVTAGRYGYEFFFKDKKKDALQGVVKFRQIPTAFEKDLDALPGTDEKIDLLEQTVYGFDASSEAFENAMYVRLHIIALLEKEAESGDAHAEERVVRLKNIAERLNYELFESEFLDNMSRQIKTTREHFASGSPEEKERVKTWPNFVISQVKEHLQEKDLDEKYKAAFEALLEDAIHCKAELGL